MLCDSCSSQEANIFFKAIVSGKQTKLNLCESCAKDKGIFSGDFGITQIVKKDFGLLGALGAAGPAHTHHESTSKAAHGRAASGRCPVCATTFAQIAKTGFAGCPQCYDTFHLNMRSIVKRIHGASTHSGRTAPESTPAKTPKHKSEPMTLERLKESLSDALKNEDYEKAARLRDRIRATENA